MKRKLFSVIGVTAFAVAVTVNINLDNTNRKIMDITLDEVANAGTIACESQE